MNYQQSGVNVELAENLIKNIEQYNSQIGSYAAEINLPTNGSSTLVASCDGVGTKILLALKAKTRYGRPLDSIGQDCVAMVVNDLLCADADPLFFMDYYATGELVESDWNEILSGIKTSLDYCGASLIGGETAEMPGMFQLGATDVCGFGIGIKQNRIQREIQSGDILLGLPSTGFHSNGFSLIRKVLDQYPVDDETWIDALLAPTKIYTEEIQKLHENYFDIKAISHITGGGFRNLSRVIPEQYKIKWRDSDTFYKHESLFKWIQTKTKLSNNEMRETFNCGIGMIVVVTPSYLRSIPLDDYAILGEIK